VLQHISLRVLSQFGFDFTRKVFVFIGLFLLFFLANETGFFWYFLFPFQPFGSVYLLFFRWR